MTFSFKEITDLCKQDTAEDLDINVATIRGLQRVIESHQNFIEVSLNSIIKTDRCWPQEMVWFHYSINFKWAIYLPTYSKII